MHHNLHKYQEECLKLLCARLKLKIHLKMFYMNLYGFLQENLFFSILNNLNMQTFFLSLGSSLDKTKHVPYHLCQDATLNLIK